MRNRWNIKKLKMRDWDDEHYKAVEEYCDISLKKSKLQNKNILSSE